MSKAATTPVPWHRWAVQVGALRAAFAARQTRSVSPKVSQYARLVFMDTIGCMLAGRRAPEVVALEAQLGALEPGGFPMPGGRPLGVRAACQLLAIGPTWHEACEGHAYAHGRHRGAVAAGAAPRRQGR